MFMTTSFERDEMNIPRRATSAEARKRDAPNVSLLSASRFHESGQPSFYFDIFSAAEEIIRSLRAIARSISDDNCI
jgi:hypothetical protein